MTLPLDPALCKAIVASDRWRIHVDENGCHQWQGTRDRQGYGQLWINPLRTAARAHRVAWVAATGRDIPAGLVIDHLCRVPGCVNPGHMEAVTNRVNVQRGVDARPRPSECPSGHPLTADNVRFDRGRWAVCRECAKKRHREYHRRRRVLAAEAASRVEPRAG